MTLINRIFVGLVALIGSGLLFGGIYLAALGGSLYYALAGVGYLIAGVLLWQRRASGTWLMVAIAALTVPWALWESGTFYWALFPRLLMPFALGSLGLLLLPSVTASSRPRSVRGLGVLALVLTLLFFGFAFVPHGVVSPAPGTPYQLAETSNQPSNWFSYGRSNTGTRYAPFTQINRGNVKNLELAWTIRTGWRNDNGGVDSNTPLQIGDKLYTCTPKGRIAALDADTGKTVWNYQSPGTSPVWNRCRGLGYYKVADTAEAADAALPAPAATATSHSAVVPPRSATFSDATCKERIIHTTLDAHLIELDAKSGKPCLDFGNDGIVNLQQGMGTVHPGAYFQTSAPLVARHYIIIGGWVIDNQSRGEPSGVIRAFDARTGKLAWAWDLGNPNLTGLPREGETYTRGTPNMWSVPAFDDKLGLLYLPLGNETPDYYGVGRLTVSDEYNSTLVALDIESGREKWHFQTVHHDLWDYDLPSQPALVDLPDGEGGTIPAVMQTTKRGQIFLLNRATGKPIVDVEEKPVPTAGGAPGEKFSPTQPYSVGMPTIGAERLTEKKMWGMTMLDQLYARIRFKQVRYEGDFTPIGVNEPTIEQPGNAGGLNWGSVSYDPINHIAYINDIRIPTLFWLIPRDAFTAYEKEHPWPQDGHGPSPQLGAPYGMATYMWVTPWGTPFNQPPYGTLTAIDLDSKKVLWQRPAGTTKDTGPFGIKTHLPMPVGMPTYAGTMTTAGGLVFFAGFQDYYLRAYDAQTGKPLWKYRLPVGASATPMSYISPTTGQQYIVLSVGGAAHSPDQGDYVMAFALPDAKK
ncbi:membrane-bound PQQ-dependent dehydrogenase, glucose/quinate/shikimate family (plasmid) [Pseudomonas yamanorum]|nr:membrane-bound PQQ-dependent dehydrogenase, glucose/quinate/shikimate family [Pseudomonas yamanorum]